MAASSPFHRPAALQASTVLFVLVTVLVADAEGRRHHGYDCPSFSCGNLRDVSYPFRQRGDPPGCGVQSYELDCTDAKATIRIGHATYDVVSINYAGSIFRVVEADLRTDNSCLLPRWDYHGYMPYHATVELAPSVPFLSIFANCSQPIGKSDGYRGYRPVTCLSTNSSFVYVFTRYLYYPAAWYFEYYPAAWDFEPSCGYLAMTPTDYRPGNANYADVLKLMRSGFDIRFPYTVRGFTERGFRQCLLQITRAFQEPVNSRGIIDTIVTIVGIDFIFWCCVFEQISFSRGGAADMSHMVAAVFIYGTWFLKWIAVFCRFVLMPLAVLTFLAHKYWKARITISAVDKFLRMQEMLGGPTRFAYTDITAITGHFREKLGQGGYGSVYKGVLLPGGIHVAVKMLGGSGCNGDEFISEVATIGRIHHVNVVRLVGFCSEETRRALVYEYMPRGSLDKFIFSAEKSFSWDKLVEIAKGIARGINYLHQGCDMQILHFDIKPHNILLDSSFVPKVADFGLAKLFPRDDSFVPVSAARGTVGYIAPEMISRSFGAISSKSDVYSFGMLLLEMAGGRRNANPHAASSSQAYYPSLAYRRLVAGARQTIVDEVSSGVGEGADVEMHELEKKLCMVGLWCIQMRSRDRPTMGDVVEMLEAGVDNMAVPPRPFFCDDDLVPAAVGSYGLSSELDAIDEDDDDE